MYVFTTISVLLKQKRQNEFQYLCYKIFQCQIICWLGFRYVIFRLNFTENSPIKKNVMLFFSEMFQFFLLNLVLGLQEAKGKSNILQLRAITETRECYSM